MIQYFRYFKIKSYSICNDSELRAKLLYRSIKCGILENDLILGSFARQWINKLNHKELEEYSKLLAQENDWDIFKWCTSSSIIDIPQEWQHSSIIPLIRQHVQNKKCHNNQY